MAWVHLLVDLPEKEKPRLRLRDRACRMSCLLPYRRRTGATKCADLQPAQRAGARVWTLRFRAGLEKRRGYSPLCSSLLLASSSTSLLDIRVGLPLSCWEAWSPVIRGVRKMDTAVIHMVEAALLTSERRALTESMKPSRVSSAAAAGRVENALIFFHLQRMSVRSGGQAVGEGLWGDLDGLRWAYASFISGSSLPFRGVGFCCGSVAYLALPFRLCLRFPSATVGLVPTQLDSVLAPLRARGCSYTSFSGFLLCRWALYLGAITYKAR